MSYRLSLIALFSVTLIVGLVGCGTQSTSPSPSSATPTVLAQAGPTATVSASPVTPLPPTATPTLRPTASMTVAAPTAAATARPTASVSARPTAVVPQTAAAGKIVFETGSQGSTQIDLMNPDGTGRQKVADGRSPIFSPDGQRIAFLAAGMPPSQTNPFGKVAIRSVKLDGSDPQDICTTDGNARLDLISWSPDGRTVMMTAGQGAPSVVFACDVGTHSLAPVFDSTPERVYQAWTWTPNGKRAAWQTGAQDMDFNMYFGDPSKNGQGATQATRGENRLSMGPLQVYSAARISPDGKTLALGGSNVSFVSVPGQQSPLQGKTVDAYAGDERNVFPADRLAWSPDGKSLLVTSNHAIRMIDVATGQMKTVTRDGGAADWSRQ
ncbi:MAG: hypothetical protein U0822_02375 [Anaerolineae bacterium]